jgi:CRISPR/Cas system-associated exonuclease Cas4 (RecB family)
LPTAKLVQITAWSYSRLGDYEKCPALAKFKHIDKLKEPGGPAMDKGNRVHGLAQVWVTGKMPTDTWGMTPALLAELRTFAAKLKGARIPPELERFEKEFEILRKAKATAEENWCFRDDWTATRYDDWNRVWLRVKTDAHYLEVAKKGRRRETTVHIIDYKTGREYPEHVKQRSLYALGAFLKYPDAVRAVAEHWYLEAGVERKTEYAAADLEDLKAEWSDKTTALLNDTTFAPRPGAYCQYCHFRKAQGGPCVY